jgi:glyoxylase-like metal-dependent hydrolase (beta-lactamase superfamily II)
VTIHSYLSPVEGEMVCAQVIETPKQLVVVDALELRPYAQELRHYIDRLGKPIARVVVTHSHPDHWFGLEFFQDVPIYSLPETQAEIEQIGDYLVQYRRAQLGELIPAAKVVPSHIIQEGKETIDGVDFVFTKVVDAEHPFLLMIELPSLQTLVAQDLVYNNVYLCVGEQNSKKEYLFDGWIRALRRLQENNYAVVLAGHGEPTDAAVFPKMIEYIASAKQLFETGIGEEELKQKLIEKYPTYRVTEMLDLSNIFLYHRTW